MKSLIQTILVLCMTLTTYAQCCADLMIVNLGEAYTEDFSSYAGSSASIPANFEWTDGDFSPGGIYDASGSYSSSNSAYALTHTDTTERAFGSKSPTSGTDYLNWTFSNATGSDISKFVISWDVEQYSTGGRATEIDFNYNPNGSGFTQTGITGSTEVIASTGANANLTNVITTARSIMVNLPTALQNGESIIFGWGISNGTGSGSNVHIGVDNLSVSAVPEPSAFLFGGLVCSVLGLKNSRRRNRTA